MNALRCTAVLLTGILVSVAAAQKAPLALGQPQPIEKPPGKGEAIFHAVNTITISGPAVAGGSITWEGLPPGTTKWIQGNPFGGGVKGAAPEQPAEGPNDRQILQLMLDLQKSLKGIDTRLSAVEKQLGSPKP